ncbi:response regulator [Candidatus Sumerlaeota bacterium]|nr:response regulator [Candidatus Sumerlaeota bacterium]
MRILIVDDDPGVRDFLRRAITREKHEVFTANNGEEGVLLFEEERPDLVLSDIRMPGMDGLAMLRAIRERSSECFVVMITGFGSEAIAVEALRLHANDYLSKPIGMDSVLQLLRRFGALAVDRELDLEIRSMVERRRLSMKIDNRREMTVKIVNYLVAETSGVFSADERQGIRLGLVELIMNAVEHGNLGITYEEKSAALREGECSLDSLYQDRLSDPVRANRRVTIEFSADRDMCEWIIRDEGEGFDWRKIADPLEDIRVLKPHGRGVFLSRFHFDELEYLGKGNAVRAAKHIRKETSG